MLWLSDAIEEATTAAASYPTRVGAVLAAATPLVRAEGLLIEGGVLCCMFPLKDDVDAEVFKLVANPLAAAARADEGALGGVGMPLAC